MLALCGVLAHGRPVAGVRLARCVIPHVRQSLSFFLMVWIAVTGGRERAYPPFLFWTEQA